MSADRRSRIIKSKMYIHYGTHQMMVWVSYSVCHGYVNIISNSLGLKGYLRRPLSVSKCLCSQVSKRTLFYTAIRNRGCHTCICRGIHTGSSWQPGSVCSTACRPLSWVLQLSWIMYETLFFFLGKWRVTSALE